MLREAAFSSGLALLACAAYDDSMPRGGSSGEAGSSMSGAAAGGTAATSSAGSGGTLAQSGSAGVLAAGALGFGAFAGSAAATGGNTATGGSTSAGSGASAGAAGRTGLGGQNAGGTGASGSGGVVISPGCTTPPVALGTRPLIDDLEDRDGVVASFEQRSGGWFTYNDMSAGMQLPAGTMPRPVVSDRGYSMHTSGSGFTVWGAGIGFVINNGCPYDASVYQGFSFYLKGSVNSSSRLLVRVRIAATTPIGDGGTCSANCFDHYSTPIDVSAAWTPIRVAWTTLAQAGFGTPAPFQANAVIGVNFEIAQNQTFDIWLDDLNFF